MKKTFNINKAVFCIFVVLATIYAGGKAKVIFPRIDPEVWYFMDSGSVVSNNVVSVRFVRNPILPGSANIFMDGMEMCYTNADDWAEHSFPAYSNRLDQLITNGFDLPWPDATNYNWAVYTDWTPSPQVHTNGVAFVAWSIGPATNNIVTYRTGIYTNQTRLAPNPWITNAPSEEVSISANEEEEASNED